MSKKILNSYLKELTAVSLQGDAREESYYPVLSGMLLDIAGNTGGANVHVTTNPKKTDAGNPDFRLWNGSDRIIGYIEAKRPDEDHLDDIEESEQLERYRSTFPNLILTNFLEFRLYRNGERIRTVAAARPLIFNRLRTIPPMEKPDELLSLLDQFFSFSLPRAFTAESLAIELAKRTRFLRDVVDLQLEHEKDEPGVLTGFFEAFQMYLIGTLTPEDFSDLFAQTITYGMFSARTRAEEGFTRRTAFEKIPHTIGVLRDLFRFISLGDLPDQLAWCVDDIAEVLAVADASGILDKYYHEGKGSDPIVHFYETFLAKYDPEERERRGVYYTPEPVVGYIVRSLHDLLKTKFGRNDGLASDGVTLLDPAAGTMTFIARAAERAVHEYEEKYGGGGTADFIRDHIMKNFYAFELMMAPYAVGHLKMGFFLEELGHRLADNERIPFYLTNTLDNEELEQSRLPGLSSLAEESRLAGVVKKQTPILVILGNPPYSGQSNNPSEFLTTIPKGIKYITGWSPKPGGGAVEVQRKATRNLENIPQPTFIGNLIRDYFFVDDQPLGEKNPKWLHNDYVKFLRFAQWKIEQAGCGITGMITDNSYLDNPTFRGMRQNLLQTFDEIYILDLHGNSNKKEICPDGSPDKNVFDIKQGVAITIFIKTGTKNNLAVVRHHEIWGSRDSKSKFLDSHNLNSTEWTELTPKSPNYFFIPRDNSLEKIYNKYPSVIEIFPVNSVGIVTARDKLTIQCSPEEMWRTVTVFSTMETELARQAYNLGKDVQDWKVSLAKKDLDDSGLSRKNITPILYRPFDKRFTYYTGLSRGLICRPRFEVMRHMLEGDNLAIIMPKRVEHSGGWQHAFISKNISDHVSVSLKTIDYHFPLYLYHDFGRDDIFAQHESQGRRPNLDSGLVMKLTEAFGSEPSPEDIFHYIYAVLYSPAYREKYAEFLKSDFPRVPFPADARLFQTLASLGGRLTDIHLLHSSELNPPSCRYEGEGDNSILKGKKGIRYAPNEERVYVNEQQYFAPVPGEVWDYKVGGYKVCEKWLKDRRERHLDIEEIRTYCRIVTALELTMEIQSQLDTLYEAVENDILMMNQD